MLLLGYRHGYCVVIRALRDGLEVANLLLEAAARNLLPDKRQRIVDRGNFIATLQKICQLGRVQDWRVFEFSQRSKPAFREDILALSAPPAVEWTLGLVGHVLVDSVILGYAATLEFTVIPRLVHERI